MKDKRTITIITAVLTCFLMAGCATAKAEIPDGDVFASVSDRTAHEVTLQREAAKRAHAMEAWNARQAEREAAEAAAAAEAEWIAEQSFYEAYEPSQPVAVQGNPNGLNSFDGVYRFDDHMETYYSTPAAYDDGLTVDEQGFYRTPDGYYVVASSEHAEGEHVQISQGEAVVMDSGPEAGVIDVHTAW